METSRGRQRDERREEAEGARDGRGGSGGSWLQLAVTWFSGLLIVAVVGYLVWEGTKPFAPAAFEGNIVEVRQAQEAFFVRLEVSNTGGQSVQGLIVGLELRQGEEVVESAEGALEWLPEGSTRELVLIVERDPELLTPAVTFDAYQIP